MIDRQVAGAHRRPPQPTQPGTPGPVGSGSAAATGPVAEANPAVDVASGVDFPVPVDGETWAVGAVILNQHGQAFAHKRSPTRRLFPGCWDIVGGHVEPGETLLDALAREVEEETGWRLRRVRRLLGVTIWFGDDGAGPRREAAYLVDVDGDLNQPALEPAKHIRYHWFRADELARLNENRACGDHLVHDLIAAALDRAPGRR